jgi:hypothetical protein
MLAVHGSAAQGHSHDVGEKRRAYRLDGTHGDAMRKPDADGSGST